MAASLGRDRVVVWRSGHVRVTAAAHAGRVSVGAEQAGVLILRAWLEGRSGDRLRVRVTRVLDGRELPVTATASIDDACAQVRTWLETLVERSDSGA
jgi:hypothetical protein